MKNLKFNEIGSNFFEEDLKIKNKKELPQNDIIYLDSGRNAIRLIINNIKVKNKRVLLPAYTCDTVIEPFLDNNYKIEYYDINENFMIDKEEFKNKVEKCNPEVILIHAYFGKDTIKNIRQYLNEIKNNIFIIEDITHLLLQDNLDIKTAHFILGSIRKWCTIPEGGFLKNNTDITFDITEYKENNDLIQKHLKACRTKQEYSKTMNEETKQEYLKLYSESKKILDNNQKDIFLMSRNTKNILRNSDFEYIKNTRRKNYNYLYENLKIDGIINQLGNLQETETPFYFPLYVNKQVRKEFQQYMAKENIFCPIIWKKDKRLNIENYYCNNIYDKIICIPCDQRYNEEDMNRIVKVIKKFYCKG